MKKEYVSLHKMIDLEKWTQLQDALALATGMAIITVDYKGIPITKHSGCHMFCKIVREDSELHKNCQRCDSRGGLEATRLNRPYMYLCHYQIVDAAIPIMIDDKYIGAVMVGQIILKNKKDMDTMEQICTPPKSASAIEKRNMLQEQYNQLPSMSLEQATAVVEMLFHLCNYIVGEAIVKNLAIEIYEKMLSKSNDVDISFDLSGYPLKALENVKQNISSTIANAHMADSLATDHFSWKPILKPAYEYIHNSKNKDFALQKVAALCHISPSYFSKLFAKEAGETYSRYISRLKIERAKQLLTSTNMTVSQISNELEFSDDGYFIKIFKKNEGITPLLYRKYILGS